MSDSRAALERKAELYDRLAAGAPLDEAEAERYEVDFALKGGAGGARDGGGRGVRGGAVDTSGLASATATGGLMSGDMAQERERRAWEEEVGATLRGEAAAAASAEQRHEVRPRVPLFDGRWSVNLRGGARGDVCVCRARCAGHWPDRGGDAGGAGARGGGGAAAAAGGGAQEGASQGGISEAAAGGGQGQAASRAGAAAAAGAAVVGGACVSLDMKATRKAVRTRLYR